MGWFATGDKTGFLISGDRGSRRSETDCRLNEIIGGTPDGTFKPEWALDLYKFYQERVEVLRTRLWTMLVWLAAAQGVILAFIIKDLRTRSPAGAQLQLTIDQPILAFVLAAFGIGLSTWMLHIIDDGSGHIENNWRRADIALKKKSWHVVENDIKNRRGKHAVCRVMAEIAGWARFAFFGIAILALLAMVDSWLYDLPWIAPATEPSPPKT